MPDLGSSWTVLETEMLGAEPAAVRTVPTGTAVSAGPVEAGVDALGRRHLIIPLLPGEGFSEDRTGRGVQMWRLTLDKRVVASLVCLSAPLNDVFERLALEVLREAETAQSPARTAADVLRAWKDLLASAGGSEVLGDERLVGVLGELLWLEQLLSRDPLRRVNVWTGPSSDPHDFVCGDYAVEIKATTVRAGRIVGIHGVEQLDPSPSSSLHLVYNRFSPAAPSSGDTLPEVIRRLVDLGVNSTELYRRLTLLGYSPVDDENYRERPFLLVERRVYDTKGEAFPKIVASSFTGGTTPAGTLHLSYAIDLTNEPPTPLSEPEVSSLLQTLASRVP